MHDAAEDLLDLEDDYQDGLHGVDMMYENARMHDVRSKLILRTHKQLKARAESMDSKNDIAIPRNKKVYKKTSQINSKPLE